MNAISTSERSRRTVLPGWSVPLVFVVAASSQYVGAALGVFLFDTTEPATVAWLRAAGPPRAPGGLGGAGGRRGARGGVAGAGGGGGGAGGG
ncbi:hypothetical protein [Nocardia neocaledoniensis]|uniref:hypothetical protein n=1 Tax=Nocardia neocaledoniensis TaxID=236511 RepID=UPI0024571BAB|nr:hypothetical protein [Nocardia neocaledoniensis]